MSSSSVGATGLAGRYAKALLELAEADEAQEVVAEDLKTLQAMIVESGDLFRVLRSPVISREDQSKAVIAVMDKAGMTDLSKRFVGLVANNRRLFALPQMIKAYLAIYSEKRGEVTAEVTSATVLSGEQMEALKASLKKSVGSEVAVEAAVDPSLLGGLVVKIGSRMVDSSLRTKLQQLRLVMKGVG